MCNGRANEELSSRVNDLPEIRAARRVPPCRLPATVSAAWKKIELEVKGELTVARRRQGGGKGRVPRSSGFLGLEHLRLELVALGQLVELGAIALRELGRLRYAAPRYAQYADQVLALESPPRLLERGELCGLFLQRLLDERCGDDARGT